MRSILLPALLLLASLVSSLAFSSCASNDGGSGDGTYTAPPTLSPVDTTTRMQNQFREWRN